MNKLRTMAATALTVASLLTAGAQSLYICRGGDTATAPGLEFTNNGTTVNQQWQTSEIDSITTHVPALRFVGGDISLLPTYEEHGAQYKDRNGQPIGDVMQFLKDQGWNAMRVRLFVDPSNASASAQGEGVRQDLDYVVDLARRIKEAGLLLLLDFHYSDTWADPGKQWTPKDWLALDDDALAERIYDYTTDVLRTLNAAGASPDFVQTGNEISYGMLWGAEGSTGNRCYMGSNANWPRFIRLLTQAGRAVREQCPRALIVLHTERAAQPQVLLNFYQQMAAGDVSYDIIGLSYYPYFHGTLSTLNTALSLLEANFSDKDIMVVETGASYHWPVGDQDQGYPTTNEGQRQFTADLIATLHQHAAVKGLFWWFPEANEYGLDWNTQRVTDAWYNAGLFDNETGCAQEALYELRTFK